MRAVLAHIGGVPVEENLIYVAPVVLIVGFIYLQSWRERRHPERRRDRREGDLDWDDDVIRGMTSQVRLQRSAARQDDPRTPPR